MPTSRCAGSPIESPATETLPGLPTSDGSSVPAKETEADKRCATRPLEVEFEVEG